MRALFLCIFLLLLTACGTASRLMRHCEPVPGTDTYFVCEEAE
jgi:hypothetical protein